MGVEATYCTAHVSPLCILVLVQSVTLEMPFTFSKLQIVRIWFFVYRTCDNTTVHATAEYKPHFLDCRIPNNRVFPQVYQTLQDASTYPSILTEAEQKFVQMVQHSPCASRGMQEMQDVLMLAA